MEINKLAEQIDALRIFPRIALFLFMLATGTSLQWYLSFETVYITSCDAKVMEVVLKNVQGATLIEAKDIACGVTGIVERPSGYTFLISTLIGSAAIVFGFYANSGRRWDTKP